MNPKEKNEGIFVPAMMDILEISDQKAFLDVITDKNEIREKIVDSLVVLNMCLGLYGFIFVSLLIPTLVKISEYGDSGVKQLIALIVISIVGFFCFYQMRFLYARDWYRYQLWYYRHKGEIEKCENDKVTANRLKDNFRTMFDDF